MEYVPQVYIQGVYVSQLQPSDQAMPYTLFLFLTLIIYIAYW